MEEYIPSEDDLRFMRLALALAQKSAAMEEVPVGAVVVHRGEVVGEGYNRIEELDDATTHAELLALREASSKLGRRLNDCTIYCTVEPCAMCAGAMILARIGRVVFGAEDAKFGAGGSVVNLLESERFNHRPEVVRGVLAEESQKLLKEFFRRVRAEK
jgi:tRNA(adenine34) deaminase